MINSDNIDLPPRPAWAAALPCIRCQAEITEPGRYVFCSDVCQELDLPSSARPDPAARAQAQGAKL